MCNIIYKTINQIDGKIYVGKHYTSANDGYLGSGPTLKQAIKKYGRENFVRETLEHCISVNVYEREKNWIADLSATNPDIGYNISLGGQGVNVTSEETKRKLSLALSGKKNHMYGKHMSEETKRKLSIALGGKKNPNYGKHLSEATKRKQSQALIGLFSGKKNPMYGMSGEKSPSYGKHMSEETKQKISKSNSSEKSYRNKYRFVLSDGRDYWKDLTENERHAINNKFRRNQTDRINYKGIIITRELKEIT